MNFPRDQFFSHTRFTQNQNVGVCPRHQLDLFENSPERGAPADDLSIGLGLQHLLAKVLVLHLH